MADETLGLLSRLVALRSSQEDDAGPMVDFATGYLKEIGLAPALYGDDDRPAVFARSGKGGVVLSGHLDTVPIGAGWTKGQGETVDGRVYGRGACDMKGGCAALMLAARRLADEGTPFSVCLTLDEEITMNGAKAVAEAGLLRDASAVVVAEPTAFNIVVREKGLVQFALRTKGRSAHASMPVLGENAIAKMVSLLHRIEDLQRVPDDPIEELTVCVDTISGGTQVNVIPDGCEVEVDSRFPPALTADDVLGMVRERLSGSEYELEVLHVLEPVVTDPESEAVRTLLSTVGEGADVLSVPYATEMVMFKADNPTLMVCGPGDPRLAHVVDEWVAVEDVARAADIYLRYCTAMAGRSGSDTVHG